MKDYINKAWKPYLGMFLFGGLLLFLQRQLFTLDRFLSGFPIAAFLSGSYLWIRIDLWRNNKTIEKQSGKNESIRKELVARRFDCRCAFFLLLVATLAQALLLRPNNAHLIFLGVLLILVSFFNVITWLFYILAGGLD